MAGQTPRIVHERQVLLAVWGAQRAKKGHLLERPDLLWLYGIALRPPLALREPDREGQCHRRVPVRSNGTGRHCAARRRERAAEGRAGQRACRGWRTFGFVLCVAALVRALGKCLPGMGRSVRGVMKVAPGLWRRSGLAWRRLQVRR